MRWSRGTAPRILNATVDGLQWSAPLTQHFIQWKRAASTQWICREWGPQLYGTLLAPLECAGHKPNRNNDCAIPCKLRTALLTFKEAWLLCVPRVLTFNNFTL